MCIITFIASTTSDGDTGAILLVGAGVLMLVTGLMLSLVVARRLLRRVRRTLPVIDLNSRRTRRAIASVMMVLTLCTLVGGVAMMKAAAYMESNTFCGEACHTVMQPEYEAFQRSPHSGVNCVDCHVGPGLGGFVRAKLTGTGELIHTVRGTYDTPIQTPVHSLPDVSGTCLRCHSREANHGVRPHVVTQYAEDEANTETKTVLMLDVGGREHGTYTGMHWHADPDVTIRFRSDESREVIHEVEMTSADGTVKTFRSRSTGTAPEPEWRTMDCVDCHNRPAHTFTPPDAAIDDAIARGQIAADLPFLKREAMRAITADYGSHDEAQAAIAAELDRFYAGEHPEVAASRGDDIANAADVLSALYRENVYPTMNFGWNTHADHRGHAGATGCFRCHTGDHMTDAGETISFDCRVCHTIVAWEDASEEVLSLIEASE